MVFCDKKNEKTVKVRILLNSQNPATFFLWDRRGLSLMRFFASSQKTRRVWGFEFKAKDWTAKVGSCNLGHMYRLLQRVLFLKEHLKS